MANYQTRYTQVPDEFDDKARSFPISIRLAKFQALWQGRTISRITSVSKIRIL